MLDWAGEVPANPGVTGKQNSDTPTCGLWCHTIRTKLGEERQRGLRQPRPREAINRSCPVCLVAADKCLESKARKCKDDDTAIRLHERCCRRLSIPSRTTAENRKGRMSLAENHTSQRWQPGQRDGLKPIWKAKA